MNLFMEQKQTDIENKHAYQRGGGGGINWELELTDTYDYIQKR